MDDKRAVSLSKSANRHRALLIVTRFRTLLPFTWRSPYGVCNLTNFNENTSYHEQVKLACMRRYYSPRTASSYAYWCRQYFLFHNKCHPGQLGKQEIEAFLNHLVRNLEHPLELLIVVVSFPEY